MPKFLASKIIPAQRRMAFLDREIERIGDACTFRDPPMRSGRPQTLIAEKLQETVTRNESHSHAGQTHARPPA